MTLAELSLYTLHNKEIKVRMPNGSLLLCIHLCCVSTKPRYSSVHFSLIMLKFSSHLNFFGSLNKSTNLQEENITEGDFCLMICKYVSGFLCLVILSLMYLVWFNLDFIRIILRQGSFVYSLGCPGTLYLRLV